LFTSFLRSDGRSRRICRFARTSIFSKGIAAVPGDDPPQYLCCGFARPGIPNPHAIVIDIGGFKVHWGSMSLSAMEIGAIRPQEA
jgi:hypothetical protein